MLDPKGDECGRIELRRVLNGAEARYRATFRGEVIGRASSLRPAVEPTHYAHLRARGPGGPPHADWGGTVCRRAMSEPAIP